MWGVGSEDEGDETIRLVNPREAINRRQEEGLIILETAIYRVFVI
ncbi:MULTISPECIES: hypothetical protein [unclassified Nostoc]|nr:hypothetical protein [Nostoc sp. KVJ20]